MDYYGQTLTVRFEAYDKTPSSARSRLTANDFELEIEFNSIVLEKCYASTLQAQSSTPSQTVSFFEDPQPFTVSLVTDTGTAALQSVPGHESDTCGDLLYTPSGDINSWVIQDITDKRLFTFDLNKNYDLVGTYKLKVDVTSVDYPNQISALPLEVDIEVKDPCIATD